MTDSKQNILFLCTGNSARSQMAEGFLKAMMGDRLAVHSAGLRPKPLNPLAVQVMQEMDIDISQQKSKSVKTYMAKKFFQYVITVCDHAEENCPTIFMTQGEHLHWSFEDPAAFEGTDEEKLAKFRQIRDQIQNRLAEWVTTLEPQQAT